MGPGTVVDVYSSLILVPCLTQTRANFERKTWTEQKVIACKTKLLCVVFLGHHQRQLEENLKC